MAIIGPTTDHDVIRHWANTHRHLPAELLPIRVDGIPTQLLLIPASEAHTRKDVKVMPWPDFFANFDLHGLAFVFDESAPNSGELLQIESRSPYRVNQTEGH